MGDWSFNHSYEQRVFKMEGWGVKGRDRLGCNFRYDCGIFALFHNFYYQIKKEG